MKKENKDKNQILLEIGTEPLPAGFVYSAIKQLKTNARQILKNRGIICGEIESFDTNRRLVLLVKDVEKFQKAPEVEIRGPSKEIAFDDSNKPTRAFLGFLKKTGLKAIDIKIRKTDQGEYLFGLKKKPALKIDALLPEILKDIIDSIKCPKNMRWFRGYEFIRPIRWILAFWQDKVIKFEIAKVKSANITYGHQVIYQKPIKVKNTENYFNLLKKHYVLLDFNKRREFIEKGLNVLAHKCGGRLVSREELLEEVTNLVEFPDFLSGKFNKEFLSLPTEVLITVLKNGQKLFAVQDKNGKIMPFFIAVINNKTTSLVKSKICINYENILEAKLKDSIFFLKQDTKKPLASNVASLKDIIFHKDLGSMFEKVERIEALSKYIAGKLKLQAAEEKMIERCAFLSKADLTSNMVKEFPTLEGVVGYRYALISQEENSVARGILEHYLPRFQDDELPKDMIGCVVGLADRIDTLVSCFSIGLIPTGSLDPYALRRKAYGLVRILLDKEFSLSLEDLIDKSLELLKGKIKLKAEAVKREVKDFLCRRLKQILNSQNKRSDLIEAILTSDCDDFLDVVERLKELDKIFKSKKFFQSCKIVERTANILKKAPDELPEVNSNLLKETLEKQLLDIYNRTKKEIKSLLENKEYKLATELYADAFFQPVHIFFDKVLINVDNAKIRNNRLSLMRSINSLYTEKIADLSKVNF